MAKGLLVRFYKDAKHMKFKSEAEGRPIYEDRNYVSIICVGDNKNDHHKEVTDVDKERFPEEWDRFERGEEQMYAGTPLKEWPGMKPSTIKMLEHFHIYVVEQLAELDDASIQRVGMGARELKAKAIAYVAKARDNAAGEQFAAENESLKNEMEAMKENFKHLADGQEAMQAKDGQIASLAAQVQTLTEQITEQAAASVLGEPDAPAEAAADSVLSIGNSESSEATPPTA